MKKLLLVALACVAISTPVNAERRLNFEPQPSDGATIRFWKSTPSIDLQRSNGAVQITPLGLNHGRLSFSVVAMNLGQAADNFGIEDITVSVGGADVGVLTRDDLERQARNRATRAQIAVALLSGVAAAAAASSTDTYSATTYGPRGTYRTYMTVPSVGGQIAANNISRDGAYAVGAIQNQLDGTRAMLAEEVLQTTTIDPEDSYGGMFVLHKLRGDQARFPQTVTINVSFNGEVYPFTFQVTRPERRRSSRRR